MVRGVHRRNLARAILERAQQRGEVLSEDVGTALDLLYGFSIYHLITGQVEDEGHSIEATVDLLVHGLTAGGKVAAAVAGQGREQESITTP